jgi:hypothetical protein
MTYFLDFDRTIFDFESFFLYLADFPELSPFRERMLREAKRGRPPGIAPPPEREALWVDINTLYAAGSFVFLPDSLSKFVFPDALEFLKTHGASSVIVTSGGDDLAFQKGKVSASGVLPLVSEATYIVRGKPKGPVVQELLARYPGPYCFTDDLSEQIDSVIAHCPELAGYEMRRDGKPGSGAYPVIRSLSELPQ